MQEGNHRQFGLRCCLTVSRGLNCHLKPLINLRQVLVELLQAADPAVVMFVVSCCDCGVPIPDFLVFPLPDLDTDRETQIGFARRRDIG